MRNTQAAAYWLRLAQPMAAKDVRAGDTIVGWADPYHGWQLARYLKVVTQEGPWIGSGGQQNRELRGEGWIHIFATDSELLVIR